MKKSWNNLTSEEKKLMVAQLNETFIFENYKDVEEAAYNLRTGYEEDPDWFNFEITDLDKFEEEVKEYIYEHMLTYDVEFNNDANTNSKGWRCTLEECQDYISQYNGTNESYFEDYKGGTVSIRCNETEEVVFETEIK